MAAMLCADDYALTEGVSRGIEDLAATGRLSATSALVTTRHWPAHARRVAALRSHCQVGLHVNLTLGAPLGAMPLFAPGERLPPIMRLVRRSLTLGSAIRREIEAEVHRQITAFATAAGAMPDFIDGHQHAHALPGVRGAVLDSIDSAYQGRARPWIRDPADTIAAIFARGGAPAKAVQIAMLARGFGAEARRRGYRTNHGFAGVSPFDRAIAFDDELGRFFEHPGPAHLIMCHPGHVDDELATLDPVVHRRADEYAAIAASADLPARIITGGASWFDASAGVRHASERGVAP